MFGTIDLKLRPIKLAFLVEPNNSKQVGDSIKLNSTLWGGRYFPIIPVYKKLPKFWKEKYAKNLTVENMVKGYIDAFDPDILVKFIKNIPEYIDKNSIMIINPEDIWQGLNGNREFSPNFGIGIFDILKDIFEKNFKFKAKYPIKIVFPQIPEELQLFWTSYLGEIPTKLNVILQKYFVKPLEIEFPQIKIENLSELLKGNVLFPRRIINHSIKQYNRSISYGPYIFFLDATKVGDIIDYWNLRALGKVVLPIPKQLKDNKTFQNIAIDFIKKNYNSLSNNGVEEFTTILKARNCTDEELKDFTNNLNIDNRDKTGNFIFSVQNWYPRIWDEWARSKDGAASCDIYSDEENSVEISDIKEYKVQIPSLLPKFLNSSKYTNKPYCANEISFRFYGNDEYIAEVLPKFNGKKFISAISGFNVESWRVGRNGLIKLIEYDFTEIKEIPVSQKIFFSWLEDLGWKPKLSPPGLLAKQVLKKLEGYPSVLQNEKLLGLLEHMNGGTVHKDLSPVEDNKVNQERDLPAGEIINRLKDDKNLYAYLIRKGVFRLGLRIQCPCCLRNSWYPLDRVNESITCMKCLTVFDAVGNIDKSVWTYKTSGPFSVADYAEGSYSVLLSLNLFKRMSIRISPVTNFKAETPSKKELEADYGAFWTDSMFGEKDEGILFGECKTYGEFKKKDFDRITFLAEKFPGSVLVFSTLRKSLSQKEINKITKIVKKGRKYWKSERPINPVLILTGNELLSNSSPPFCWSDQINKKYDRYQGLIKICDATQQIYLNLPSWEKDWHEEIERRYKKQFVYKNK